MSAHFDPVVTLAFGIRRDMSWGMVVLYWITGHYINRGALVAALAARHMVPEDVDKVFLSHIHFDHAGNVDLFTEALIYLGKADWEYVRNPAKDDLFIPWGIHERLSKNKLELLDHDGDIGGGLAALELPGHTPGSMGLRFEHATNGTVVRMADRIIPGHVPELKREGTVFTPVGPQSLEIQFK
jgi:glyoxylase-like metal-dependent hydrolase (beta-lactamase superfamily II)